ncbi:MAG: 50S ribosomal protein L3 glutamine methyltransferase [Lysobacteraceae bacterium]|nr:MAG: 50S ribosomal protein L3 glutamine methyltransferase [Xanthomonadaceae bacterium]
MPQANLSTIRDWVRYAASEFSRAQLYFGHGTDNALDEAHALVMHCLALPPDLPASFAGARLAETEIEHIAALMQRRIEERIALPYLTGEAWFAGLCFEVDQRVLIPRSPIGELITQGLQPWLDPSAPSDVLELCTGSGCIAVATAHYLPNCKVLATDLSEDALQVAETNRRLHGVADQLALQQADLFDGLKPQLFDLIIANPPYVSDDQLNQAPIEFKSEPRMALVSAGAGLWHALKIMRDAPDFMAEQATLLLEVGANWPALEAAVAGLEWLQFEQGGEGVCAVSRSTLLALRPKIEECLNNV